MLSITASWKRKVIVAAVTATVATGGFWMVAAHVARAITAPAQAVCTGNGSGQAAAPGNQDFCAITVTDATFFPNNTTFTLTFTGPAGVSLLSCQTPGQAPKTTVLSFAPPACTLKTTANTANGDQLALMVLNVGTGAVPGSKIAISLTFPGFPPFTLAISGPGATVGTAPTPIPTATPTPTPRPSPTAVARLPRAGVPPETPGLALALPVLVCGLGLSVLAVLGFRRRRRSYGG